jgi:thioredoxin reductase/NAD-dependent dihydropyrimidine dehydrogenase PreA subunit
MSLYTVGVVAALMALAFVINSIFTGLSARREEEALLTLDDLAALGDIVPETIHPVIDGDRCIGSSACVRACPEKKVIDVVHGRAVLLNALACVGHAECVDACPVDAIRVVFGSATRGVELPDLDTHFQTTKPGVYVVGELGGMGLIRNALRQGKQAADHVIKGSRRGKNGAYDAVIVGAGPAGLGATLRLLEGKLNVKLLEREQFGGTIMHYPRKKVVMTGTLDFPLHGKVRRSKMSKEDLLALWERVRIAHNLPLETGILVNGVNLEDDGMWKLTTSKGDVRAANVMLGLGRRGSPRKLGVKGEDLSKVNYRLLEPEEFKGQHVIVVGGGDSAVESAAMLADMGTCASVSLSYRRAALARCRGENKARIEACASAGFVNMLFESEVLEIRPKEVLMKVKGADRRFKNDAVIIQVGGTAPSELLAQFGIDIVTKFGEA